MARPKRSAPVQKQRNNRQKKAKNEVVVEVPEQSTLLVTKSPQNTDKSLKIETETQILNVKNINENEEDEEDGDYDENEDDDYDPLKKMDAQDEESEDSDNEPAPDYSAITTDVSQVRTRGQKFKEIYELGPSKTHSGGLLEDFLRVDVDAIFESLQTSAADEWAQMVHNTNGDTEVSSKNDTGGKSAPEETDTGAEEQIRIFTTYTFAGKLVREAKTVAVNSAEAKAYLNSTNGLALQEDDDAGPHKSYVSVVRKVAGSDEEKTLRIKLKRPSLIDKFLAGDKKNKLTTLEKSRLDWASFVDKKKLKDDLAIHNKGGYLEKQDFLGRMEAKRDTQYQQARELDRQRQWQQQQQQQGQRP